jgi:serine/threonine protein kinase
MDEIVKPDWQNPDEENAESILNRIIGKSGFVLINDRSAEPEPQMEPDRKPKQEEKGIFKNIRFFKAGGMANIYLAVLNDPQSRWHDKKVVIKRIIPEKKNDENYIDLFYKEYLILRDFDHENILRIISQGEDDSGHFYISEFVNGKNLDELIEPNNGLTKKEGKRKRLSDILFGILSGIQGIHEAGIIHRDIKPANILIANSSNKVKIIDFGLAKADTVNDNFKEIGTVPYASPEQLYNAFNVDNRTDIYSFGIILLELITGSNDKAHCDRLKNLFPNLVGIINKCTEEQVDRRYQYVSEIVDDLMNSDTQFELIICREKTIIEINKEKKSGSTQKPKKKKEEGKKTGKLKPNRRLVYGLIIGLFVIIAAFLLFKVIPFGSDTGTKHIEFSNKAGEIKTLDINFPGKWNIQSTMDWIEVNRINENDNQIIVKTLSENNSFKEKTGLLKILDENNKVIKTLDIKQTGLTAQLSAAPNKITFEHSINEPYVININSNLSWTMESDQDWIATDLKSGKDDQQISVSAKYPNLNEEPREGKIILKALETDKTETIFVVQRGQLFVELDRPFISFDITSKKNDKIKVSSNTDWKFGEIPAFLKINPTSGRSGNTEVNIAIQSDNVNSTTINILASKTNNVINSLTIDFSNQKRWSYDDLNNYLNKIRNSSGSINFDELFTNIDPKCQVYFYFNDKKMTSAEDIKTFINKIKFGSREKVVENSIIYNSEGLITEFCQE